MKEGGLVSGQPEKDPAVPDGRKIFQGKESTHLLIRSGLIGGAVGGEAMVLLVLANTILLRNFAQENLSVTSPLVILAWSVAYPLLVILVFEIGGIFSSWLCRDHVSSGREALMPGIIAGITTGIILEIMWVANILSLASRAADKVPGLLGYGNSLMIIAVLLVLIMMGGILSGFGSYIFSIKSIREG